MSDTPDNIHSNIPSRKVENSIEKQVNREIRGWVASYWDSGINNWVVCKFFKRKRDIPKGSIAIIKARSYTNWQE